MIRLWMAGAMALLLLPAASCQKSPQETQSPAQKEGAAAIPPTAAQESKKEQTAQTPPAKSQADMAEARRQLEQQGAQYTEAVFLESVKNGILERAGQLLMTLLLEIL